MNKEIRFCELVNYNDSNSLVWTSLIMRDEDIQDMNDWFHEIKLIPNGKSLRDWKHVSDNVLENNGRSDILLIFDHPELAINPMVRLRLGSEVKWTSDFISNFKSDYKSGNEL